ncbi:cell cycle protein [Salinisphaera sp. T5B8]|uniref:tRNA lysidine(34) synthetase TilS n=1 Tax=Salinisphaera sp. T5B8 TaxID=1304154 RepID=UPI00334141B0
MNDAFAALPAAFAQVPTGTKRLAVAFSGGLDSTALLHALIDSAPTWPVRAIHVCHHLQPEAQSWALACARQAEASGVAFTRLDVAVETRGRGLEAAARKARYAALEAELARGETLITAHHARDQAETFVLQALRGAGPQGLAAMPRVAALGAHCHWRPWLHIDHDTITAYARAHQLDWIDDPSNHDPNVARSFLREAVMPELRKRWPQADRLLSRSAAHAGEAAAAIDALADIDLAQMWRNDATLDASALATLDWPRAKQVVRRWLDQDGHDRPDHRHVAAIVALGASRLAASPCVAFADTEVRLFDGRLYAMARLAPVPERFACVWHGRAPATLPAGCGEIALAPAPPRDLDLEVRLRRGGERVSDAQGGHRGVKDILREARLAPWLRARVPLVYHADTLIAIGDIWRHPHVAQLLHCDIGRFIWRDRPA